MGILGNKITGVVSRCLLQWFNIRVPSPRWICLKRLSEFHLPLFTSGFILPYGTICVGQPFSGFLLSLRTSRSALGGISAVGLNCWLYSHSRQSPSWLFSPSHRNEVQIRFRKLFFYILLRHGWRDMSDVIVMNDNFRKISYVSQLSKGNQTEVWNWNINWNIWKLH